MSVEINKKVTVDTIVAYLYAQYGIEETGWRADVETLVLSVFREVNVPGLFPLVAEEVEFTNYKCKLPCRMETLDRIEYASSILEFVPYNPSLQDITRTFSASDYRSNVCYIDYPLAYFGTEIGKVVFHYYATVNGELVIPTVQPLINYIHFYIIRTLLFRGLKHPLLTLEYVESKLNLTAARNACRRATAEQYFQYQKQVLTLPSIL